MGQFAHETAITATGEGTWSTRISEEWNIGPNANGGYLLTSALRAAREVAGQPDPFTVTTHFFRPGIGDEDAEIEVELLKPGRTMSTVSATLSQQGKARIHMLAGFGDLDATTEHDAEWTIPMPDMPGPDECIDRRSLNQGVQINLMNRCEIRVDPSIQRDPSEVETAEVFGWTRFRDEADADVMALPFFADAFPPTVFTRLGPIGWVPTLELTVQVRRRPAPGWLACHVWTDDTHNGKLIESVRVWDSTGALVAQGRQLGLLITGNVAG
ncbi:MAG: thioesterase family protein [Actinomycetota bacterium]